MRPLILLFLCASCISKESPSRKDSSSHPEPIALEEYAIGLPKNEGNNLDTPQTLKCDSLRLHAAYDDRQIIAVAKSDSVPLWTDPGKKEIMGFLNFADTVRFLSEYSNTCSREMYCQLKIDNCMCIP